jgi:hypothetical protein
MTSVCLKFWWLFEWWTESAISTFFPSFFHLLQTNYSKQKAPLHSFYHLISSRVWPKNHSCSHCHKLNLQTAANFKMQRQQIPNISANVRFENSTTVAVNITVSWYMTPCRMLHKYRRSALTRYLIHQATINSSMKLEATSCSEILVRLIQTTRHYIQERLVSINAASRYSYLREKS